MVETINESLDNSLSIGVDAMVEKTDFDNFDLDGLDVEQVDGVSSFTGRAFSVDDWKNKNYLQDGKITTDGVNINFESGARHDVEKMMTDYFMSLNFDIIFPESLRKSDGRMRKLYKDLTEKQEKILDGKLELVLPTSASTTIKIGKTKSSDISNGTVFGFRKPGSNDFDMVNILFNTGGWGYIQYDGRGKEYNNVVGENLMRALKETNS